MPDWTTPANGNWADAARWTGGVPNAAGATANFIVPNPGNATILISFSQNANITVGMLNVTTDSDQGWTFQGEAGVTSATLRFQGAGGGPAFLNADTNNSSRVSSISDSGGMKVTLASDLIITTADSATAFEIRAPITGAFDVYKFGGGTLRISGGNSAMTGDYFLNGGRTELTSANGVGGGSLITLNNGATLASVNTFTLANNIETASGNKTGVIAANAGTTLTLTGEILLRSSNSDAVTFGSVADTGTIVLSGTSSIAGTGGFHVGGGTLRLGSAGVAANYFSSMSANGIVSAGSGGVLDTRGFAATIDNLVLGGGGTLQSSTGALNVTSDHSLVSANLSGSVVGTAQADRLVFNVANDINMNGLTFSSWTNGTDTITINGSNSSNQIVGTFRNDIINGGGGGDTLLGGGGVDTISGGTGDDTYIIADAQSTLIENAGEGSDTVLVTGGVTAFTLAVNFEKLTFQDSGQHTGIGNTADNVLTGGSGIDTLNGGGGADIMAGGQGNDTYFVDNSADQVIELANQGNDTIFTSVSYGLAAGSNVELLAVDGIGTTFAINLNGNALSNTIWGNNGANIFHGFGGGDAFLGFGGDDVYFVTDPGDRVLEDENGGFDTVFTDFSYGLTPGASIELLAADGIANTYAINLNGNALSQTIWGNNGINIIHGGGGGDAMLGFGGDDTYFIDDVRDRVLEDVNGGNDSIYSSVSYTLTAGAAVELLSADGIGNTYAINLTGNELGNTIWGNNGVNVLNGGSGADALFGFGGADTFAFTTALGGGNVDAIFDFASASDKIALDDAVFAGIGGLGTLNANAFFAGTAAHDADDRIIYDQASGNLFFDADGNGAGAQILFATLQTHPAIAASDFQVI